MLDTTVVIVNADNSIRFPCCQEDQQVAEFEYCTSSLHVDTTEELEDPVSIAAKRGSTDGQRVVERAQFMESSRARDEGNISHGRTLQYCS